MMDSEESAKAGCLIGGCLTAFVFSVVLYAVVSHYRAAAVTHGVAEWLVNKHGDTTFQWKEVNGKQPAEK